MIFSQLHAKNQPEQREMSLNSDEFYDFVTAGSAHVSVNSAMALSAVYACVYVLSSSLAQLPLHVLRKTDNTVEKATDHAAFEILSNSPNFWQTSYDWRESTQSQVLGWGNGYTEILRNRRGEITGLEMHQSALTTLEKRNGNRYLYVTQDEDGKARAISPEDMIHIKALGSKGKIGESPIRQHAKTLGLGLSALDYGNKFFASGGKPTGIASAKAIANGDAWDRLKKVWKEIKVAMKEPDSGAILLPADIDYKQLVVPPEEAQFLETRKFNRSEIAGIYNVPAHMINDLEKATFSNISEQAIQFIRHSMMPWVVKWEQEQNRKLFTSAERKAGYYVKFNLAGLLRGTPKERAEFYHFGITDGWMNRNEARVFEDMNPVDGLNEFLISVNQSQKPESDPNTNQDQGKEND